MVSVHVIYACVICVCFCRELFNLPDDGNTVPENVLQSKEKTLVVVFFYFITVILTGAAVSKIKTCFHVGLTSQFRHIKSSSQFGFCNGIWSE